MSFGILTMATMHDYRKAIGMAMSVRLSNPGVPLAITCSETVRPLVEPYFDQVVIEDPNLRGFRHKIYLDKYSPFEETFFFDSDVLIFRPLSEIIDSWRGQAYTACGTYLTDGISAFGLDRAKILKKIGHEKLACIDGAGHAYFKKPECTPIFDLGREIMADYPAYVENPQIRFADEDVMNIVMTLKGLKPQKGAGFFSRHLSAVKGTLKMDASQSKCEFVEVLDNTLYHPYMMHFAANEAPFPFARQLVKLYHKFGVKPKGIWKDAVSDYWTNNISWPAKSWVRKHLLPKRV